MELNKEALRYAMIGIRELPYHPGTQMVTEKLEQLSKKHPEVPLVDIKYALKQAIDAKLIQGAAHMTGDLNVFAFFNIVDITPAGHEFIDSIINDTHWNKVKNYLKKNGLPITIPSITKAIANVFL